MITQPNIWHNLYNNRDSIGNTVQLKGQSFSTEMITKNIFGPRIIGPTVTKLGINIL